MGFNKKVVLVVANTRWFGGTPYLDPVTALPILASILKEGGYEYDILDCNGANYSEEECKERIKAYQPEMVLISALTCDLHRHHARVAELAKMAIPSVVTVMGGVYATTCYEHIMKDENVDYVMFGHAEERLCQFLDAILENADLSTIAGIGFRKNGEVIINPVETYIGDIKRMVQPDYSKIDLAPYADEGYRYSKIAKRELPIMTSYGCPHNCVFCATRTVSGRKVVYREVEDVIEELRYLKQKYEVDSIVVWDDNLLSDEKRAVHLLNRVIEEKFGFKIRLASTAAWHLKDDIIDLLAKAGCYALTLSVESGCDRVLHDIVHKPLKKEIVPGVIKKCQEKGIFVSANYIIGFPGETWDEIRETISFAEKCNADQTLIFIATLMPKTDLYKIAVEKGCIEEGFDFFSDKSVASYSEGFISTDEFTPDELEILRVYEWDRINFSTEEKRKRYCEFKGISDEELTNMRKITRRNMGKKSITRKR